MKESVNNREEVNIIICTVTVIELPKLLLVFTLIISKFFRALELGGSIWILVERVS